MTYASESFEAYEEWERWLDAVQELEGNMRAEEQEIDPIKKMFSQSSEIGEKYFAEQGLTKQEVLKRYPLSTDKNS